MQSEAKAYLKEVEQGKLEIVQLIRDVIFEVVPGVEERIDYGMLDYPGLANLAAQKQYVALYVAPAVLEEHRAEFPGVSCGKSCLRFKKLEQAYPKALRKLLRDVVAFRKRKNRDA